MAVGTEETRGRCPRLFGEDPAGIHHLSIVRTVGGRNDSEELFELGGCRVAQLVACGFVAHSELIPADLGDFVEEMSAPSSVSRGEHGGDIVFAHELLALDQPVPAPGACHAAFEAVPAFLRVHLMPVGVDVE